MAKGIMYVDNIRVEFDDEPTIMDLSLIHISEPTRH